MIWLSNNSSTFGLSTDIQEAMADIKGYIYRTDLYTTPPGRYEIDGNNLFVNIMEYQTKSTKDCIWEAHRDYLDCHYIISDSAEIIKVSALNRMNIVKYHHEQDYVEMTGEEETEILLNKGCFIILYPNDAHQTGVIYKNSLLIKKAVFKIKIKEIYI